jgi:3-phosphoshikimate 1-carboxyvinyltransferase
MVDEIPVLLLATALAQGESVFEGLHELRVKESDRLGLMIANLKAAGVDCNITENDGAIVRGKGQLPELNEPSNWMVDHDHRLAMTGVIAGLCSPTGVLVSDVDAVAVSWPNFVADVHALMQ